MGLIRDTVDGFEFPHNSTPSSSGFFKRFIQAVAFMVMDQRLFRILDRALDGLQLLCNASFAGLDHFNDRRPSARLRRLTIAE
jgi:hypothetical protein